RALIAGRSRFLGCREPLPGRLHRRMARRRACHPAVVASAAGGPGALRTAYAGPGHAGVRAENVNTRMMSLIRSFLNQLRTSQVSGRLNSHIPKGALPTIAVQLPALPRRVLMTPSTVVESPPTGAPPGSVKVSRWTGT